MSVKKNIFSLLSLIVFLIVICVSSALGENAILKPSGLAETSWYEYNGVWYPDFTVKDGTTWATALDTNDYDISYAQACCGGPTKFFYAHLDNPQDMDEDTRIVSVQVTVVARYLETPILIDPLPIYGDIDIGYKTGSETVIEVQHSLNAPLGAYTKVVSEEYFKDSDGGELDIFDINNLQVFVGRNIAGSAQLKVTQVYATIRYNNASAALLIPIYSLLLLGP
ncbi:MAG: hypothetical protein OEM02_01430 [Desulfobulbaceae bacterium]|nr:hypothetical protein [Desulfobulbaceae bacterium]